MRVEKTVVQVREYRARGETRAMTAAKSDWAQEASEASEARTKMYPVKINLVDILEVDTRRRVVVCEPLVSLAQLMARLDRAGWTLPIVPDLDQLTVGGLVMGAGLETSSHRQCGPLSLVEDLHYCALIGRELP